MLRNALRRGCTVARGRRHLSSFPARQTSVCLSRSAFVCSRELHVAAGFGSSAATRHNSTQSGAFEEENNYRQDESGEESAKSQMLDAALPFVHVHGWSVKALADGASVTGFPSTAHGLFPRGGIELVNHYYCTCNQQLVAQLKRDLEAVEAGQQERKKTATFIKDALRMRLETIVPYADTWPEAMGLQVLPQNARESWSNLLSLVDDVWHLAGDASVDINWYTKRLSVAYAYKSSEIFLLTDKSHDKEETWRFLERRLSEVATAGQGFKTLEQCGSVVGGLAVGASQVALNMLGVNSRRR